MCQFLKNKKEIVNIFSDINSKNNFNQFLKILLDFKYRNLVSSDYSFIPHKNLGFMTYYFLAHNLSKKHFENLYSSEQELSLILKYLDKKLELNYFLKTENLYNGLKIFLKKKNMQKKQFKKIEKNSSKKTKIHIKNFITKQNLKLIEQKDSYLFEKFKYKKFSNYD